MGVVVRRYIDFLILLIPTPLVSVLFCSSIPTFFIFKNVFRSFAKVLGWLHTGDRSEVKHCLHNLEETQ